MTSPATDPGEFDRYAAELTSPQLVQLQLRADSSGAAVRQLSQLLFEAGRISDLADFVEQVNARESQLATGLPGGIGMPHARSSLVERTSIAVGVTKYGHRIDFGAVDGPANVVLLIATPATSYAEHLEVLATMARSLSKETFRQSLRRANDAEVIAELINTSLVFYDH